MATESTVPSNAPEHCPGTASDQAGQADACKGCPNQAACASAPKGTDPDLTAIAERLSQVKHIVLVLSGKGGVGKSTFAAQLSWALASQWGAEVGLLDIDICGPSMPKMLGLEGEEIHQSNLGWSPVYVQENLGVMSIGFLLPDKDDAVIWRGPRKNGLIKQFLKDVNWGRLDYLVIDAPPGTSDEHISIAQFLKPCDALHGNVAGAVVVTTPQEVSLIDVRKEINFCRKTGVPVLGVIENMAGLAAPLSNVRFTDGSGADITEAVLAAVDATLQKKPVTAHTDVFWAPGGGAEGMANTMGVPFLGRVPLDLALSRATEEGRSLLGQPKEDAEDGSTRVSNGTSSFSDKTLFAASVRPLQQIIDRLVHGIADRKKPVNV